MATFSESLDNALTETETMWQSDDRDIAETVVPPYEQTDSDITELTENSDIVASDKLGIGELTEIVSRMGRLSHFETRAPS